MDPNNPIVKLCAKGMSEEARGNSEAAAKLFHLAWDHSSSDFERCIAAHYVARHQAQAERALDWNQRALDSANRIKDDSAAEFFPSLYLNLGKSHEDIGHTDSARELYRCAANGLECLPAGAYRDIMEDGIKGGLQRVANLATSV